MTRNNRKPGQYRTHKDTAEGKRRTLARKSARAMKGRVGHHHMTPDAPALEGNEYGE